MNGSQKEKALEYEQLKTLATVRGLGRIGWDAMGEVLLVEVQVGNPDGPLQTLPVTVTPEAAAQLQEQLLMCLMERADATGTRQ